jgi:trehalose 6-phosphate phosphatase
MSAAMSAADLPPPPPLEALLQDGPVSLFLDFDGTLVDLAAKPDAIAVPERFGERLARLSNRLGGRLALVSGRAIEDLERHCGPLAVDCAGSHGAERRQADGSPLGPRPEALPPGLLDEVACFARVNGIDYERKPHGAALHSRGAPQLEEECALFMAELAEAHGLELKRGKRVAELVRRGADKGRAVRAFMAGAPFAGGRPVFVGDDATDEDGFAACADLGGFGIAVGPRPTSVARFGVADPAAVQQWLTL